LCSGETKGGQGKGEREKVLKNLPSHILNLAHWKPFGPTTAREAGRKRGKGKKKKGKGASCVFIPILVPGKEGRKSPQRK